MRTHAPYSAGSMRCTSKGGRTRAITVERAIRAMLEAEPCRILRVCNIRLSSLQQAWRNRLRRLTLLPDTRETEVLQGTDESCDNSLSSSSIKNIVRCRPAHLISVDHFLKLRDREAAVSVSIVSRQFVFSLFIPFRIKTKL